MFSFELQITRTLHDEHLTTINVLEKLEGVFRSFGPKKAPEINSPEITSLLNEMINLVECDVNNHFTFEEEKLFPILDAAGDTPISFILGGEHEVILPLGIELSGLAKTAREKGFEENSWLQFRQKGAEMIERMISHIQKEEMALLPMLEDIIEEDQDTELMMEYAEMR